MTPPTRIDRRSTTPPVRTDVRRIAVSPGVGCTFDGDRWCAAANVRVRGLDGGPETLYRGSDADSAVDAAISAVETWDPAAVWIRDRGRLVDVWSNRRVTRAEERLAAAAGDVDATVVAWGVRPRRATRDYSEA